MLQAGSKPKWIPFPEAEPELPRHHREPCVSKTLFLLYAMHPLTLSHLNPISIKHIVARVAEEVAVVAVLVVPVAAAAAVPVEVVASMVLAAPVARSSMPRPMALQMARAGVVAAAAAVVAEPVRAVMRLATSRLAVKPRPAARRLRRVVAAMRTRAQVIKVDRKVAEVAIGARVVCFRLRKAKTMLSEKPHGSFSFFFWGLASNAVFLALKYLLSLLDFTLAWHR